MSRMRMLWLLIGLAAIALALAALRSQADAPAHSAGGVPARTVSPTQPRQGEAVRSWNAPDGVSEASVPPWAQALGPGEAESPTGRRPRAIWTGKRQAIWNALSQSGNQEWANALRSAAVSGTSKGRYADLGQWATVAYQATGDRGLAEKAWRRIERKLGKRPPNRNFTREHLVEYAWMYDWLKPALNDEQRGQFIAMMNDWCRLILNLLPGASWGTRLADSDETVGHYFGLALWAAVSGEENPQALRFLRDARVGGYDATGANRRTWRNAISEYVRNAKGGVWLESSKYNLGTLRLLLFGAEAIRTATGRDHFPEITVFAGDVATAQLHELTSDLKQFYQWGDEEDPRNLHVDRRCRLLAMLTGLVADEHLAGQALALFEALPPDEVQPRELTLYNPLRPAYDWRMQPTAYAAEGMGFVFARSGWDADAAFFGAHMPSRIGLDHEVHYFGDFQLYRAGEWVVTHPLGYRATDGQYVNGMLLGGWPSMWETRGLIHHGMTDDGIVFAVGSTAGSPYGDGYVAPPPSFLHEWTRSLVFVPSRRGKADILLVHDRTLLQNPKALPRFGRYHQRDRSRMEHEIPLGLRQWIVHMPVEPMIEGRTIQWTTDMGQPVSVTTWLPERITHRLLDERAQVKMSRYVKEREKGWQVRVVPQEEPEWQTLLHVIQMGGGRVDVSLVRSKGWEGVTLTRPGELERTILFNAEPGKKLPPMKISAGRLARNRAILDRLRAMTMVEIQ